jgi:hypothetical protein
MEPGTNVCLWAAIQAWAQAGTQCSTTVTAIKWEVETDYCLPEYSTNYGLCPGLLTNWWVVSSPGFSGSGMGDWVYFIPTNCGSGTVTFYGTWKDLDPCTLTWIGDGTTISNSINFTVVNVQIHEPWKAVCTNGTTSFTLTNTCGPITWSVSPQEQDGPYADGSTIVAGTKSGSWTVTATSTLNPNCTASATLYVVGMTSQCLSLSPPNRDRTSIGVGESVDIWANGTPTGNVSWRTSGGWIDPTNGNYTRLWANPNAASPITVTVYFDGGTCDMKFDLISPDGYIAVTNAPVWGFGVNVAGSGMFNKVWLSPTNVSFGALNVMEVGAIATNATGYFANTNVWPANLLDHSQHGANQWYGVNSDNYFMNDHACSGICSPPWSAGHFSWPIPAVWSMWGYCTNSLPWSDQDFTIDDSGTVTVSKFGHIATRNTNDVYTTFE